MSFCAMKRYAEAKLQLNPKSDVKLNAFPSQITKTWIFLVCIFESFACYKFKLARVTLLDPNQIV